MKHNKGILGKIIFWVLIAVLVAVIVWCLWQIIGKYATDSQNQDDYDSLSASKDSVTTGPRPSDFTYSPPSSGVNENLGDYREPEASAPSDTDAPSQDDSAVDLPEGMIKEYALMYALNNDMVGWIEIPGTSIDYPVVQSPYQSNFYLRRNFYKQKATCGTIYVREKCDVNAPSDNVTIYGHNMRIGTMFADLHKYEDQEFWKNHSLVYFDTMFEYHTYEIFAVFISSADMSTGFSYHTFDNAKDSAEFDQFVQTCKSLSLYDTGITPVYGEKLITLSTCDKSIEDGRLVVVARRIM